jgi:hypothetical protein
MQRKLNITDDCTRISAAQWVTLVDDLIRGGVEEYHRRNIRRYEFFGYNDLPILYCLVPELSYLVTKKSFFPVRVFPSRPPVVYPPINTFPEESVATLEPYAAVSSPKGKAAPNCFVPIYGRKL